MAVYGNGSIFQRRSDGRWVVRVPLGVGEDGRRVAVTEYHRTEADARAAHVRLLAARATGTLTTTAAIRTVAELVQYHLDGKRGGVRPQSLAGLETRARLHILPALGPVLLADLTTLRIESWLRALSRKPTKRGQGLSAGTIQNIKAFLSETLEHAVDLDLIPRNPARRARLPALPRPAEVVPYTTDQIGAFLTAAEGTPLYAFWLAACLLGLRRGELAGLTWPAVDLAARELRVVAQIQRVGGELVYQPDPKSRAGVRPLPIPEWLAGALSDRWQQQQDEIRQGGPRWGRDGWRERRLVFTTKIGHPYHPSTIDWQFKQACRRAGVPVKSPHALRHSQASLLLALGVAGPVARDLLGHTDERQSRHYQHTDPAHRRAAIEAVERAIRGQKRPKVVSEQVAENGD